MLSAGTSQTVHGGLGILVLGFSRPLHLQSVLESLRLQGALDRTHVWIDGTHALSQFQGVNTKTLEVARRYQVRELRAHRSNLTTQKIMLQSLTEMTRLYDRVMVLEDDCFPLNGAIDTFEKVLAEIADKPEIYSVYGCPYGTEPADNPDFGRFRGWGWAAHSWQIRAILPELWQFFLMTEKDYLAHVAGRVTPAVRERLATPGSDDILKLFNTFYSWDVGSTLVTASRGQSHRRTPTRTIVNTGISPGVGHFPHDIERLRKPPHNMITVDEAWHHFEPPRPPAIPKRDSYGLDGLDRKILKALPKEPGFFIELGAYDGVDQNNSLILEQAGWRGLLVEPIPARFAQCLRNRPAALVEHAACVGADYNGDTITLADVGLMSLTGRAASDQDAINAHLATGEKHAKRRRQLLEVPVRQLSQILDKHKVAAVDLLILDVEGAELDVLAGLDFARHAPRFLVVEERDATVADFLAARGYGGPQILA